MKNKKHIFIPLFVFIGACLVSLIWSVIDYTAFNKVQSYSYEVIQFDYDGASDGKDPDGNAFNAVGFLTDDVIQDGLEKSGLENKYTVDNVRKCIDLSNVVPKNIIKEIESYESLINAGKGRELTAEDYHPIRYKFSLYQELDKKLGSSKLNELLDNIVESYCAKFYLTYAKSYDNSVYDSLFTIGDYDYIYQALAYTSKIRVLSNYANDVFNEHDDFFVGELNFNDLVLKGDEIISSDVSKINNHIILNALSKDIDRLKDYYNYKIVTLNYEKTKKTSDLAIVTEQLNSYPKDSTIYVGAGENVITIGSNSEATYNSLLQQQINLSNYIASINTEIQEYQSILEDINSATGTEKDYKLVQEYIKTLGDKYDDLEDSFNDMLEEYNDKYVLDAAISKTRVRYNSGSIFSGSFVLRSAKISAPIILGTLFGICCFFLVRTLKKEKEKKAA